MSFLFACICQRRLICSFSAAHIVLDAMRRATAARNKKLAKLLLRKRAEAMGRYASTRAAYLATSPSLDNAALEANDSGLCQEVILQRHLMEGEEARVFTEQWLIEAKEFIIEDSPLLLFSLPQEAQQCILEAAEETERMAAELQSGKQRDALN